MHCPFCQARGHWAKNCKEYHTPASRLQRARERGLCYTCLKPADLNHVCPRVNRECESEECQRVGHHQALCPQYFAEEKKEYGTDEEEKPPHGRRRE
jgi:hypothetical protein